MNKPNNYDNTKGFSNFEALAPGAYICRVIDIAEMKSRTGKDMLKIALDIEEGEEAGRFRKQFNDDNRPDKKWPCVTYQMTEDQDGNCNRGLRTFLDCLEEDNKNYTVVWGEGFCAAIKGKVVGTVFRKEEYLAQNGDHKWSTKPYAFRFIEDIKDGKVAVPEDKPLDGKSQPIKASKPSDSFESISEDIPF